MALIPVSVYAAGLGKLNVSSGLGEPLKAEIELLSVSPDELSSLTATIAPDEAYSAQGIERPASHSTIKVDVAKNANGAPILKLRSTQPINDPFLDMLLQVDWASGRLLREYTVLLDPPGYAGEADNAATAVQAPSVKPAGGAATGAEMTEPQAGAATSTGKAGKSKRVKKPVAEATGDAQEYVTRRGDTLAKIARDMKPEGVSLEQMLIGLYETNPEAFAGKNINRLKTGQILRAPSQEALAAITQQDANKEVRVHTANWNEYRNKLAGMVAEAPVAETEAKTASASGKIKPAEDQSATEVAGSKDVVKLSTGDAAKIKDDGSIKSLEAKVAALQEEVTAREKGLQEAQSRSAELEKQIADMQKLLAIKNGTMSDVQKQAEQAAQVKPAESTTQPASQENPPAPVESKPVEQKPAEAAQSATQQKPAIVKKPMPEPTPEPEVSILDSLNLPLLGGGAGLLALLGGGWVYLRNKRKKNLADFEQGIMTSGGLKANTVFGNTSGSSVDTGDTSFLTDFSQSANGGMIDTHDVDPIAEAEVYMAYGRDAQAEEILKDAISKEPKRYELHLKLLEMYAASKNMSAFETVAGELYTTLGGQDPIWAKVAAIGAQLEPNNPLYQGNIPVGSGDQSLDASDFADSPLAAETDLDFNLDNDDLTDQSLSSGSEFVSTPADALVSDDMDVASSEGSEISTVNAGLDFDIGDLGGSSSLESASTLGFSNTLPDLEMPLEIAADVDADADLDVVSTETLPTISTFGQKNEDAGLSFDLTAPEELTNDSAAAELGFEVAQTDSMAFDLPATIAEETPSQGKESADFNMATLDLSGSLSSHDESASIDLSGINLDLAETSMPIVDLSLSADEPAEVDTKLDLVAAYLDMDDKVGAKELLDEVLKEGGPSQRKRAEELLQTLA